ncbi:hypothetical protein Acsp02_82460 [Actinoplanes sp. NBRC 103695]|nr:hypothetical protein Acsp02_82460 [Actinoplanes sp. NBRC 103695]
MSGSRGDQAWQLRQLPDGAVRPEIGHAPALFDEPTGARRAGQYVDLLPHALPDPAAPPRRPRWTPAHPPRGPVTRPRSWEMRIRHLPRRRPTRIGGFNPDHLWRKRAR